MRQVIVIALSTCVWLVPASARQAAPTAPAPRQPGPAGAQRPLGPALEFEAVKPIDPPAHPLSESESARVTRFSFIVYGDTRGGANADGSVVHPVHSALMDTMLASIDARRRTDHPVRFVLQTGDAVLRGATGRQWNVSYTPIIERLTRDADVPYYLTAGNHDVSPVAAGDPVRQLGLHNTLSAISRLIPPEGSPRRLNGYPTFAFGYGNVFVIAIDTTAAADALQLAWVTRQLEQIDRTRFPHVLAFQHYPPYSSGPHGAVIEPQTLAIRNLYMPLFRKHHVRMVLAGHEHFHEQWIERYTDGGREYRMDVFVTGGGGAPTYTYRGEPDLSAYLAAGASQNVRVEHLVTPARTIPENPNHFLVVQVDGDRFSVEAVAVGNARYTPFNGRSTIDLHDAGS